MSRLQILMNGEKTLWRVVDMESCTEVQTKRVTVTCPSELVLGRKTGGWLECNGVATGDGEHITVASL